MRFEGAPIEVRFAPHLTVHRGKLLSGVDAGQPVLAGSFLRRREIVLDADLIDDDAERARILIHEIFHFVWLRLGNPSRAAWGEVIEAERKAHARGELGWSSEWRKRELAPWPEYVCESFCDSAAWLYAGLPDHDEFTLAVRWRDKRRAWFEQLIQARPSLRI